jgi:putative PIN family toxin of toxin-antitoxin system
MIYAVFDTNVLVSALITHNVNASTVKVVEAIGDGKVIPLYNDEIVAEYDEVLSREKFGLLKNRVKRLIEALKNKGINSERVASGEAFPDVSDAVFYEVALSKENAYLVTGNLKHFPSTPIVVTPAEMGAVRVSNIEH